MPTPDPDPGPTATPTTGTQHAHAHGRRPAAEKAGYEHGQGHDRGYAYAGKYPPARPRTASFIRSRLHR